MFEKELSEDNILILMWTIKNTDIVCGESVREGCGEIEMMHWGVGDRLRQAPRSWQDDFMMSLE